MNEELEASFFIAKVYLRRTERDNVFQPSRLVTNDSTFCTPKNTIYNLPCIVCTLVYSVSTTYTYVYGYAVL